MSNNSLVLADKNDVSHMTGQLAHYMVGGQKLTPDERKALAVLAVTMGLNPFVGEIWYIPKSGPFVGIKGQRRNATVNLEKTDDHYWTHWTRVQAEEVGGKEGDIAFICELRDSARIKNFASLYEKMSEMVQGNSALLSEIMGPSPTIKGIGLVTKADLDKYHSMEEYKRRTKMTPVAVAKKRAESDALKQAFPMANIDFAIDQNEIPNIQVANEGGELEYVDMTEDIIEAEMEEVVESDPAKKPAKKPVKKSTKKSVKVSADLAIMQLGNPIDKQQYFNIAYQDLGMKKEVELVQQIAKDHKNKKDYTGAIDALQKHIPPGGG